jgi:O-Glycosyl hydrolase family 30/Glycosyl hydrolase family 30 beta sandwich domain
MFYKFLVWRLSIVLLFFGISMSCMKPEIPTPPTKTCFVNGVDTCKSTVVVTPLDAKISLTEEFQTIQNFGASDCWGIKFVGKNWPLAKRNEIADLLFSKDFDANGNPKGIGLSLWRINVGAGSFEQGTKSKISSEWRREECFQDSLGKYDWTKQAGNRWFAKAAKDRGVEKLLLFSIAAPVHMSKNGLASGSPDAADLGKINLKAGKMGDYADFLAEVTKNFTQSGMPIDYISPINEPQWDWKLGTNGFASQEGTSVTNNEAFEFVKELNTKITSKNLTSKIAFGEVATLGYSAATVSGNANRSDVFNVFWNPSSAFYIGNFPTVEKLLSSHSYTAQSNVANLLNNRDRMVKRIASINPSVQNWQSEYCILGTEDQIQGPVRDLGITAALYIARVIHTDLAIGNVSAWQWWLGVSPSDYKDGLVYITDVNGSMGENVATKIDGLIFKSKMLWALGNYSRFIRPGMIRVNMQLEKFTNTTDAAVGMMVSAYKNPQKKELVVVVLNMTDKAEKIKLSGLSFASPKLKTYTTTDIKELKFSESAADNITIEGKSITTFVGTYQ